MGLLLNRAQRWLEVANLGRSVFGSLGLASLAYGLLLLVVFGAEVEVPTLGEATLPLWAQAGYYFGGGLLNRPLPDEGY